MPATTANGITIEYETFGDRSAPPMLLIMGLGAQLTAWDTELCERFAGHGFFVIRFDNRDVGKSTWFDDRGVPDMALALSGGLEPPYALTDMAADAAGLLDALDISAAHIVGASMGGMIAQTFAVAYPERTLSLCSIMSTTGDRSVGQPHPEALAALLAPPATSREEAMEGSVRVWKKIGSPGYPFDEARVRDQAGAAYDRGFHPEGAARQLVAIMAQPDRSPALALLSVPALVVHGEDDPLVDPSGGRATAAAIPGARLITLPGVGHDMPPALHETLAAAIAANASGVRQ